MSNVNPTGGPTYPGYGRVGKEDEEIGGPASQTPFGKVEEREENRLLIEQYGAEAVGLLKQASSANSIIDSLLTRLVKEGLITKAEAHELSALLARDMPPLPEPPTKENVAKWLEKVSTILDKASGFNFSNPDARVAFHKLGSQMETLAGLVKSGILTPPKAGIIVALMEISWGIGA